MQVVQFELYRTLSEGDCLYEIRLYHKIFTSDYYFNRFRAGCTL